VILHTAWSVNFSLSLSSFSPHISTVRALVDLSLSSPHGPQIIFASSVGVASRLPSDSVVPEKLLPASAAVGAGYGESKWVAEMVLDKAREFGVESTSVRIGQMAGSGQNGAWNVSDVSDFRLNNEGLLKVESGEHSGFQLSLNLVCRRRRYQA